MPLEPFYANPNTERLLGLLRRDLEELSTALEVIASIAYLLRQGDKTMGERELQEMLHEMAARAQTLKGPILLGFREIAASRQAAAAGPGSSGLRRRRW